MTENLTWRVATDNDSSLLFTLFAANKASEFAPLGLSADQLQPLLEMQYRARQFTYARNYPNALDTILCLGDGTPVGRHLIDRQDGCYYGIDLSVLPEYQNRGIGSWALQQIQQLAAVESVPFRLSVVQSNPALRLYERLGFRQISGDEVYFEMEWKPAGMGAVASSAAAGSAAQPKIEEQMVLSDGSIIERSALLETIFGFLREIGLRVELGAIGANSFLPGVTLIAGGLRVDVEALLYPGDLLHEAGHLAVMPPERRHSPMPQSTTDGGEEMAAMAWSYAAAVHLGLPAEVVFHQHGYKGQAMQLASRYAGGDAPGLPLLWWMGLTTRPENGRPSSFPQMTHWLRTTSPIPDNGPAGLEQVEEVHA